jgi:hypothetical protein
LNTARKQSRYHAQSTRRTIASEFILLVALAPFAMAQATPTNEPGSDVVAANVSLQLPDSPGVRFSSSSSSTDVATDATDSADAAFGQPAAPPKHAPHLHMTISQGEIADPMTVHDKVVGGLINSVSLFSATGWLAAAGWEQLWNDSPNYGTDSGAFGERLGAAAVRGISQGILSNSLFAPVFHEDPRYYIMGAGHPFFKRLVYAGTRCIITRTDSGRTTPNFSLIAGNAAGSALTIPYYPAKNTTFSEVAQTFGGSLGGSALGFVVDEFIVDALIDLHLKKKQPQP